jgi:beta-N-acetylhexosaminidase
MKKILLPLIIIAVGFIFVFSAFKPEDTYSSATLKTYIPSVTVQRKLSEMTLREKIAQMIVSYSDGFEISESSTEFKRIKKLIQNEKIGGLIFFKGNSIQEASLINQFQTLSETPLLISADFERGTAMRLNDGSLFPSNMGVGATRNPDLAYQMGLQIAKECRAIGVHQNYAPVMDVNNNPNNPIINVRSFGENPELVSQMGDAMIKGLQAGNVIATAKHFPGHGDTDIDSHSDLPVLNFDMTRLNSVELIPFISAINTGVKSVMIAHLSFPAVNNTPYLPSSLSEKLVNQLLINQLGFKGLVVTDALNMAGVTKHFSTKNVALLCTEAGIDLILMPQGETETINAIEAAVKNGSITVERINTSVTKILEAKEWLGLFNNKLVDESQIPAIVNSSETKAIAQKIADESITLVTDDDNLLPFKNVSDKKALVISLNNGNETANTQYFFNNFVAYNKFASYETYDLTGDLNNNNEILQTANSYDYVIVPIYAKVKIKTGTVGIPASQLSLINSLVSNGSKVIVLSMGNPYLVQGFENVNAYVCAYGDSEASINATLKTLFGEIPFKGKLPVSISSVFTYGIGIQK